MPPQFRGGPRPPHPGMDGVSPEMMFLSIARITEYMRCTVLAAFTIILGNGCTFRRGSCQNRFCFPLEKWSTLKGKKLLPLEREQILSF